LPKGGVFKVYGKSGEWYNVGGGFVTALPEYVTYK
jgi:hypothetical protein